MIRRLRQDLSQEEVLQILLEELRGPCIPNDFGEQSAEEAVEKYFPKW